MARRSFTLKSLFVAIGLLCMLLGALSLYRTFFVAQISAVPCKVGEPIIVYGRFPRSNADEFLVWVYLHSEASALSGDTDKLSYYAADCDWLRNHVFKEAIEPIEVPGTYRIDLLCIRKRNEGFASGSFLKAASTTVAISP